MEKKNLQIELTLEIIKKEYKKRCEVLLNMLQHIEYLNSEHIISLNETSRYMKILNDIVKVLNLLYNDIVKTMKNEEKIEDDFVLEDSKKYKKTSDDLLNNNNIKVFLETTKNLDKDFQKRYLNNMMDFMEFFGKKEQKFCDFYEIDNMIKELVISIGTKSICDLMIVFTKFPINILFSDEINIMLIEILEKIFVPLYINIDNNNEYTKNTIEIKKTQTPIKYEVLLENFYTIKINLVELKEPVFLEIKGFFKYDCINLISRTSQIFNKIVSKKKKEFSNAQCKKRNIPNDFRIHHIKNLTIGEILANDDETYNLLLTNEYGLFQKYSGSTFKQLFKEFIQLNLEGKYRMIKILLLGHGYISSKNQDEQNTQYTNNAGLLYGLVKESKIGTTIIADIILKNLNLSSRLKLAKSNTSIKFEIEKLNKIDTDDIDFKKQLVSNQNIPDKVKKLISMKISEMKSGNSEYYKQFTYVKTLLDYPWTGKNDCDIFTMYNHDNYKKKEVILEIKERMENKVYGHKECKETIVELIGKWFSNPKSLGKAIGLSGPPGVGKTLIARELGKALGIPFTQINLGGMDDGSILSGHSITYSGAVPGLIVKGMVDAGKPRCIMFMDELDKTSFRHGRNEITDTLIHVIDQTSNSEFNDKFFQEVKFPLNKVLFIFSFNDKNKIDKILLDRMEIINVGSYSVEDKTNIINDFLIKELKEDFGFNDIEITISKEDAKYLIDSFTMEAGVRNIRRKIEKLFFKLNMDRLMESGPFEKETKCIKLTKELIDNYIKKTKIKCKEIHTVPKVGSVNGLYATESNYGGIIPILIYNNHGNNGKFKLELTGKQGQVMKESVKFGFTIAVNSIRPQFRKEFKERCKDGLHIHTPDGATPKDGPSAGCAFTLAFISVMLCKRIKNNIGLTGEIEQDGNITAIGGLESKLPGAKKAGINLVFVPKENEKDIETLKEREKNLFDENFNVVIVEHITEVLDYALIDDDDYNYENKDYNKKLFDNKKYISEIFGEYSPIVKQIKKNNSYSTFENNESFNKSSNTIKSNETYDSDNLSSSSDCNDRR